MKLRLFIPFILVIFVAGGLIAGLSAKNSAVPPSPLVGKSVPDFDLPSLTERDARLNQNVFHGEVSLLNVWASWCGICKKEHPYLTQLSKEQGVNLIGLNYRDDKYAALDVLDQTGNPYQNIIFDPRGELALDLGVYGTPETYLVDHNGTILFRYIGALNDVVWQKHFAPLVNKLRS
ncbi:DsbE family thiol:disulfide interchange protein [Vibrio sp. Of7-15]|uniref:DsbE family thiol:disulfide interchange protein n=1 Tax=Vibrio sp. Of7-15 TaxID=2724879 RepID=UPI001EF3CF1A|nr:DsbE family thiol:disulfide interchange protein [Vibrio sp. Of7-15]MCG7497804.1 DsbE family thiol:disulfide interchange protein [Vibrio sp. Of7-15]